MGPPNVGRRHIELASDVGRIVTDSRSQVRRVSAGLELADRSRNAWSPGLQAKERGRVRLDGYIPGGRVSRCSIDLYVDSVPLRPAGRPDHMPPLRPQASDHERAVYELDPVIGVPDLSGTLGMVKHDRQERRSISVAVRVRFSAHLGA